MSRSFDHDLHILRPCALGELAEANKFLDLTDIRSVRKAPGAAGIAEGDGDVVLAADIEDLVKVLIEGIFLPRHAHPCKYEGPAARDDIHLALVLFDLLDGLARDPAVERHEIHAVLRVQTDDVDKVLCAQRRKIALIVDDAVIDGDGADHRGAFRGELAAEGLRIAVRREIHDRLRTHIDRSHHLLHFDVIILAVARNAKIDVDLGAQHGADAVGIETGMQLICADRDLPLGDEFADLLFGAVLLGGDRLHFRRNDTALGGVHLRRVVSHISLQFYFFSSVIAAYPPRRQKA